MSRFARRLWQGVSRASTSSPPTDNPNKVKVGVFTYDLTGTNIERGDSQMVRYTRTDTQTVTPTNEYGVEVVVDTTTNKVTAVNDRIDNEDTAGTPIPVGSYVLSGHGIGSGYAGQWLLDHATVGAVIELTTVTIELTDFTATVISDTSIKLSWSYTGAPLSNFTLQRDGVTIASPTTTARSYTDTDLTAGTAYSYTLTGNYQAGGSSNSVSTNKRTSGGETGNLPSKLVGAYWQMYQGPTVAEVTSSAPQYNIQYAAFALGNGSSGTCSFSPAFESAEQFKTEMHASQAAGCKWLISLGGGVPAESEVMVRTQTEADQVVASVISMVDEYGFDGVDFDLENGPDGWKPAPLTSVATQLKAHYGSDFIVSMVPRPYESYYFDTAVMMGDALDLMGLQFYDYNQTSDDTFLRGWIRDKINDLVQNYNIPASKLVIGCITYYPEYGNGANDVTVYRDAFLEMQGVYPDLRGVFIWESSLDKKKSWGFAQTMGAAILP